MCQYTVYDYFEVGADLVDNGDSGSPVFYYVTEDDDPPITRAYIAGVLHSHGLTDSSKVEFWFSPIGGIKTDLGSLKVFPGPPCTLNLASLLCTI